MKLKHTIKQALYLLILMIILGVGTWLIIMYSKGYRINPVTNTITETGVVSIVSKPSKAQITLYQNDGEIIKAKTPKTIGSVPVGENKVEISKENYHKWQRKVEVLQEKSTTIFAQLYLKNLLLKNTIELKNNKLIDIKQNKRNDSYFILTELTKKKSDKKNSKTYAIYQYKANKIPLLETQEVKQLYEFSGENVQSLSIYPSPDGSALILKTTDDEKNTEYTLIEDNNHKTLKLSDLTGEYKLHWANDNKFIILESQDEIISVDTEHNIRYLLQKKKGPLIWDTDFQGYFYYLKKEKDKKNDSDLQVYYIYMTPLSYAGDEKKVLTLYTTNSEKYLKYLRQIENLREISFTNSPENRLLIGKPQWFFIDIIGNGITISTDKAAYWYNTETKQFNVISTYPINYLRMAPNNWRFFYIQHNNLYVYNFNNDEDQSIKLGSFLVKSKLEKDNNIQWLSNSEDIAFLQGKELHIITRYGDNEITLTNLPSRYYIVNNKINSLFTISNDSSNNKITIKEFEIQ